MWFESALFVRCAITVPKQTEKQIKTKPKPLPTRAVLLLVQSVAELNFIQFTARKKEHVLSLSVCCRSVVGRAAGWRLEART